MYERKSRLSEGKRSRLVEHFVAGTTARAAADLVGVHKNTAAAFFSRLRHVLAEELQKTSPLEEETAFPENVADGLHRHVQGKPLNRSIPLFGVLVHDGEIHTVMFSASNSSDLPSKEPPFLLDAIVVMDGDFDRKAWDVANLRLIRLNDPKRKDARIASSRVLQSFWNQTRRHLRRYHGIPRESFNFFIKECEWRFNGRSLGALLKQLKRLVKEQQIGS